MISIIVAVYNITNAVRKCVESILPQMLGGTELILVDDGSTDDSGTICDQYCDNAGITVIHKPNGGLSSARNAGIERAKGDWLIFVDGDDLLLPGSLERLARYTTLVADNVDFVQYGYQETGDYNTSKLSPLPTQPEIRGILTSPADMFDYLWHIGGEAASMCTKMVRRHIFDSLRFKEGILNEDEQFTTHLLLRSRGAAYVQDKPYIYVRRPGSITTRRFDKHRLDIIGIMNERVSLLRRAGFHKAADRFTRRLIDNLHILYMAAEAAGDPQSRQSILCEYRRQISVHSPLRTGEKLVRLGLPILQTEALVRKLLHKQHYFD